MMCGISGSTTKDKLLCNLLPAIINDYNLVLVIIAINRLTCGIVIVQCSISSYNIFSNIKAQATNWHLFLVANIYIFNRIFSGTCGVAIVYLRYTCLNILLCRLSLLVEHPAVSIVLANVDIGCLLCDVLKLGIARNKNKLDGQ